MELRNEKIPKEFWQGIHRDIFPLVQRESQFQMRPADVGVQGGPLSATRQN